MKLIYFVLLFFPVLGFAQQHNYSYDGSGNRVKRHYVMLRIKYDAETKDSLLQESDLNSAIKKLKIDSNYVIVAINPSYGKLDLIKEFKDFVINLRPTNNAIQDTFFVLKKSDLPTIKNLEFEESEIEVDSLTTRKNNVYTSVLDLNLEENKEIRERWLDRGTESDLRKQVQITIAFKTIITWKNQRNVIQLNIYSQFREQGIVSELTDVKALE